MPRKYRVNQRSLAARSRRASDTPKTAEVRRITATMLELFEARGGSKSRIAVFPSAREVAESLSPARGYCSTWSGLFIPGVLSGAENRVRQEELVAAGYTRDSSANGRWKKAGVR